MRAGGCRGRGLPRGAAGRPAPCLRRERPGRGRSAPGDARLRRRAPGPSSWRLTSAARSSSGPSCGAEVTSTGARSAAVCSGPASCVWSPKERSRRSRGRPGIWSPWCGRRGARGGGGEGIGRNRLPSRPWAPRILRCERGLAALFGAFLKAPFPPRSLYQSQWLSPPKSGTCYPLTHRLRHGRRILGLRFPRNVSWRRAWTSGSL